MSVNPQAVHKSPDAQPGESIALPAAYNSAFSPAVVAFSESIRSLPRSPNLSLDPQALVVGTAPLGGKHSSDVDFEVYGVEPATLRKHIEDACARGEMELVGFGGNAYLFAVVNSCDGTKFDISLPVKEHAGVERYNAGAVTADPNLPFIEAVRRRDFTFTAVGSDPVTGEVIDPLGGRKDFDDKTLRAINVETAGRDPLMTLRAIRFVALYDFEIEPATLSALRDSLGRDGLLATANARRDRLQYEFERVFGAEGLPSRALEAGAELGVFRTLFPCVADIEQHPDLWRSTCQRLDSVSESFAEAGRESNDRKVAHLAVLARAYEESGRLVGVHRTARTLLEDVCSDKASIEHTLVHLAAEPSSGRL